MASTLASPRLTEGQIRSLQKLANHINTEVKKNSATLDEYEQEVKKLISAAKMLDDSPAWKNAVDGMSEMISKQVEKARALLRTENAPKQENLQQFAKLTTTNDRISESLRTGQGAQKYTPPPMKKDDMAAYG